MMLQRGCSNMTKNHAFIILRLFLTIGVIITFIMAFIWIFSISYPFWIAALLVWMFYPLVRFLNNKTRLPKGLSVFIVLFFSLVIVAGAVTGLVFLIIFGTRQIAQFIPEWIQTTAGSAQHFFNETILPLWQKVAKTMDFFTPEQQVTLQNGIDKFGTRLAEAFTETAQDLVEGLTQLFAAIPTFLIAFVFIFVAFYFIGKDWERILAWGRNVIPDRVVKKIRLSKDIFRYRVFGFVRAQVILMFIASVIVFIGISILGVDHALTIAAIVGLAEILPYFGSGTILIPWLIYMFLTGNVGMGIGLAVVYGITLVIRQSIEPKILSTSMNINALAALISLFAGIKLFGIFGVFLGPLLLVILVILYDIGLIKQLTDFIKGGFKEAKDEDQVL